ncbi:MAG: hypothetical protein FRX49_07209 [Trebouxia sp. A1-2]|nr:MAG: hypothetical protein FRX49_07209 [Trebouxia sp. A1-2]
MGLKICQVGRFARFDFARCYLLVLGVVEPEDAHHEHRQAHAIDQKDLNRTSRGPVATRARSALKQHLGDGPAQAGQHAGCHDHHKAQQVEVALAIHQQQQPARDDAHNASQTPTRPASSRSAGLAALLDVFTGTMADGIARNG